MFEMDQGSDLGFLDPKNILEIISRRRWIIIISLLLSGLTGIYLAFSLPKLYSATTTIMIQPQRVPEDYVQSLVTEGVGFRINEMQQEILSRTNVEKIIEKFNLLPETAGKQIFLENKVAQIRELIIVQVGKSRRGPASSFSITFSDTIPERAASVANTIASMFIDQNLEIREAQAIGTSGFLEDELATMKQRLEETEKELSIYRQQYRGELPSQLESNLRKLDHLQNELADQEAGLRNARERLVALHNQAEGIESPDDQLGYKDYGNLSYDQLQAELTRLKARYTDKHPDIVRLKGLIAEYQTREFDDSRGKRRSVIETEKEIAKYEKAIAAIRQEMATYNSRVENLPQREQELLSLQRDYKNMRESYQSLLNRKLEAQIAVNMERKQKGEQFRVIDPARPPSKPSSPDMAKLFLISLVSGLGLGGAICFVLEYLNQVFRRPEEIENTLELPLVAILPVLVQPRDKLLRFLNGALTIMASGAVCLTYSLLGALILVDQSEIASIAKNLFNNAI
jgi:polysaccharide chain length determinant protein (PEP-CTERM system associated)